MRHRQRPNHRLQLLLPQPRSSMELLPPQPLYQLCIPYHVQAPVRVHFEHEQDLFLPTVSPDSARHAVVTVTSPAIEREKDSGVMAQESFVPLELVREVGVEVVEVVRREVVGGGDAGHGEHGAAGGLGGGEVGETQGHVVVEVDVGNGELVVRRIGEAAEGTEDDGEAEEAKVHRCKDVVPEAGCGAGEGGDARAAKRVATYIA